MVAGMTATLRILRERPRLVLFGAVVLALLGIAVFALSREVGTTGRPGVSRQALRPPRPAFTPAEEAYIKALWPIHGDVERSTMRLSLGQIFYKTDDMSRADLKRRVDEAVLTYERAEARLRSLAPPASLQGAHDEYLAAVRLFQESAAEVLKMFVDGRDDHLLAAYPKGLEGSNKIREVGARFWDEFPPN
ncbi:MAG: hypothetical protein L0027_05015 [Candidatus Rokubacteria bacterium]|nr:hypothetical protein [Candidatus Rokubacteria bacterium]